MKYITNYPNDIGEYDAKLQSITKLYEGTDADIQKEVVADLVGDYLFTDEKFVRNLSVNNRNVFQKIYDEIKYLCNVATAGSKEARQLEKVKKTFEQIYRESTQAEKNTQSANKLSEVISKDNKNYSISFHPISSESKNNAKSRGDIILETENEIKYAIEESLTNRQSKKNYIISSISRDNLEKICQDIHENIFKDGEYVFKISSDDFRHIEKHFNATDDIVKAVYRLYDVVNNYDNVTSIDDKGQKRLKFEKQYDDYDFLSIEIASKKKRCLDLVTFYITKNNKKIEGKMQSPVKYKNLTAQGVSSSKKIIPNSNGNVNSKSLSEAKSHPVKRGNYNIMGEEITLDAPLGVKSNVQSNDKSNDKSNDFAPLNESIQKNRTPENVFPFLDDSEYKKTTYTSIVTQDGKKVSNDKFDFKNNANQLVGRIDYLSPDGKVREIVEYASKERFEQDIKDNEYNGITTSVVFYSDEDGTTIDRKFANDLNPAITEKQVILNPYTEILSKSKSLENLAPLDKKYKKTASKIQTVKQVMKKPIDAPVREDVVDKKTINAPVNKRVTFNETEINSNIKEVAKMQSVYNVSANKLEKTGKKPSEIFSDYFNKWENNIRSKVFGDISLKNSSVKSEIRHGVTAEKIASIEAIPTVIESGKVIFSETKENSDVERIVVSAPIKIGTDDYLMGVMLQRDSQNQRLYLHNVVIAKETSNTLEADLLTTGADKNNEHLFITNILQNVLNVKNSANSQSIKKEDSQLINANSPDATPENDSVVSSKDIISNSN